MSMLPGLPAEEVRGLAACMAPVLQHGCRMNEVAVRKLVRDSINILYVSESQTRFAAQ